MIKKLRLKTSFLAIMLLVFNIIHAENYSFIGKNKNWNDIQNWTVNGKHAVSLPNYDDVVFINSNKLVSPQINISSDIEILSLHIEGNKRVVFNGAKSLKINKTLVSNAVTYFKVKTLQFSGNEFTFDPNGAKIESDLIINSKRIDFLSGVNMQDGSLISYYKTDIDFGNISHRFYDVLFEKVDLKSAGLTAQTIWIENHLEQVKNKGAEDDLPIIYGKSNEKDGPINCGSGADIFTMETYVNTDYNNADISCNGADDAEVCVDALGGSGSFTYQWIVGGPATPCWTNIGPGNYSVVVTDQVSGVSCALSINVAEPSSITSINFVTTQPDCNGNCNASVSHFPLNGTGALSFNWAPGGQTNQNPNDLCAGPNTLTVTDLNGCTFDTTINISEPTPVVVTTTPINVQCLGACDGQITANASGGTGTLTYQWFDCATSTAIPGETDPTISGLCPGSYYVEVTDANSCMTSTQGSCDIITEPTALTGSISGIVDASCPGVCNGEAIFTANGGTPPYNVEWFDVATNTSQGTGTPINTLCGGQDYYALVTDANGCPFTSPNFTIDNDDLLVISASATDVSCFGDCDGTLNSSVTSGGTAPFNFSWTTDPGGAPSGNNPNETGVCPGDYQVIVTDDNGCISDPAPVTIDEPAQITLALSPNHNSCFESCDGSVQATPAGGTSPYNYIWSPAPPTGQGTSLAEDLCVGNWSVNVTDDKGCDVNDNINITQPAQYDFTISSTNIQCNGACDGTAGVVVNSGGTPGYTYTWAPVPPSGQGNSTATGLCPGVWTLTVSDLNLCDSIITFTITEPNLLSGSLTNITDASCPGVCNGSASFNPTNGTSPYTIEWFDVNTNSSQGTGSTINTLCGGQDYYAVVTDDNGCPFTSPNFTIDNNVLLTANASATDVSCFGDCDGSATAAAVGGTAPYSFQWTTVPGGAVIGGAPNVNGLCPGDYQVIITDNSTCISLPVDVTVDEPAEIQVNLTPSDNNCFESCDGSVQANPSGGTLPYNFVWSPAPPSGQGTNLASNLCAGNWSVIVTDDKGCDVNDDVTLNEPDEYDITIASTDIQCFGDCDGTAGVTVNSGATPNYTYTWSPVPPSGQGVPNATGLCAGTWVLTVSDLNGCDSIITFDIVEPPELIVDANVISQVTCHGDCTGSANVTISGGVPNYFISWNDPSSQSTPTASGLCDGNYTVTVTDDNNCSVNDNIVITEPNAFDITTSSTDIDCNGDCDGTATITVNSGGTPNYFISWNDPLNQNTTTAVGLCAGSYIGTVTDQNGCDSLLNFTINEPPAVVVTIASTTPTCFAQCTGEITINIVGGVGPYNIEWFDATNTPLGVNNTTISNLCAGDYYAVVTDDNGCPITSPVETIIEQTQITASITSNDASCNLCDGTATVTAAGGGGGFTYVWAPAPGVGQGTPSVSSLCSGLYSVTVTDINGCSIVETVTIGSAASEVITTSSIDATCSGDCDGEATAAFVCLDPPCTIEWFNVTTGVSTGQTTLTATGLCAGDYTVVLTNGSNCVTSEDITVDEPTAINIAGNVTHASCNGNCDGEIDLNVTGGVAPYNFVWSPIPTSGQGTNNVTGLCAGPWSVQITDNSTCVVNQNFTITEPTPIDVTNVSSSDITCFGDNNGSVSVIPSGGIPPYTYEWTNCVTGVVVGTSQQVNGLGEGSYQVTVTDGTNCSETTICVDVDEPDELTGVVNISNANCFGDCNGMLDVVPTGGINNFDIQWLDENQDPIPGETNDTLRNLCAGTYFVTIEDLNSCIIQLGPFEILEPAPWDVQVTQNDVLCFGNCTGSASAIVLGGNTPPYSHDWSDPFNQTTQLASALCAGNYQVIITDINGCDTAINYTITENPEIIANGVVIDASCFEDCDGEVSVNPTGGLAPYNIVWNTGDNGNSVTNLCVGNYDVTITDDDGCIKDSTLEITEPTEITATVISNDASCGNCNGSAVINPSGGAGNYTFVWAPAPGAGQGTNNGTSMCAGIYSVTITDDDGCSEVVSVTISDINGTTPLVTNSIDASCFGACDGEASVSYTCTDTPCSQEWFDENGVSTGQTTLTATGLCAGEYDVLVTNGSGCITAASATIDEPTQIDANEIITPITCNSANDGEILVVPSGGSGAGYTYVWTPAPGAGQGTDNATGLSAGTWDVEITDGNGCSEDYSFNIVEPTSLNATFTSIDATCNSDCNGSISVIPSGGVAPYSFQWLNNGVPMVGETSDVVQNLCSGNYNVLITDATNCTFTFNLPITISEPNAITVSSTSTDISCNSLCTGEITLTVNGGLAPYTITWYNGSNNLIGQTGLTASNLCDGDYYAIISDANGCIVNSPLETISEPSAITFTLTSNDASCFSQCDGDANIVVNGGSLPYNYSWTDNTGAGLPGGNNPSVNNLCAGGYFIEVIDNNGCTIGPEPVLISENDELLATIGSNDATCGLNNGSATVNPTGGNPSYSFQWFDGSMNALPGEISNTIINLTAGTYFVTVTDIEGCEITLQANISNPNTSNVVFDNVTDASCFGECDGIIEISATPVNPPLTFVWNAGGIVAEDPQGLCAGNYTLQVTDNLGCINFYDTLINENTQIDATFATVNATCGECNGEAIATATGGAGNYSFDWTNGANTPSVIDLCAGAYDVLITDDDGCSELISMNISNTDGPTGENIISSGVTCSNDCDGTATVIPIGGTPPYTYNWVHNGATSNSITGLCEGTYTIEMIDANDCKRLVDVIIGGPNPLDVSANIIPPTCGVNDGQIIATATGGNLPYTYTWNTLPNGPVQTNIGQGSYIVTVTDASGCSDDFTINVTGATAPQLNITGTNPNCNESCDGEIISTISGGTPVYTYTWLDANGAPIAGGTNPNLLNVCEGDYTLQAEDAAGCIVFDNITITAPDTLKLSLPHINDVLCNGDCNGEISTIVSGGTLPFTYSWDDPASQTNSTASGLCGGVYTVTVTDANGCTINQISTVDVPNVLTATIDSTFSAQCVNTPDGDIYTTPSGGTQPYIFNWTSNDPAYSGNTEDLISVEPGTYYLELIDNNGCIYNDTAVLDTANPIVAVAGPDTLLCNGEQITWVGVAQDGNGSINYTWFDGNGNIISDTNLLSITPLEGINTYILMVEDSICSHTDTMLVTVGAPVFADAGPDKEVLEGLSTTIGGNPAASSGGVIEWSPSIYLDDINATNPNVIEITEDVTYTLTVTDTNGCVGIDSVNVIILPEVIFPNGISPNGDGKNDNWIITFSTDFPEIEVEVYNRWGDQLFYSKGYGTPWDGTYKGKPVPVGTYYYVIKLNHPYYPEPYTGPITVMR